MSCRRCAADRLKDFNGELAIHFPGLQSLETPIVWVFPRVRICLSCGLAELVIPDAQLETLRIPETLDQLGRSADA